MKIVVCVKRVPDTETKVKISADGKALDQSGVNYILNPYDEFAVEQALQLKESAGGEVIAISLGTAETEKILRTTLAMGADKAILLKADNYTGITETRTIAKLLATKIKEVGADIIFFGRQSIDNDAAALGPSIARELSLPFCGLITKFEKTNEGIKVGREADGGIETFTLSLPCVVSANKGLNTPRYASLKGVMAAKTKPLETIPVQLSDQLVSVVSLELPGARKEGKIVAEGSAAVEQLVKLLHEEAKVI